MDEILTDIHSHVLPGIDDGAKDLEQSCDLLKGLLNLGFKSFVFSPHVMGDYFPNNNESIEKALQQLENKISINNINTKVAAAAEYFYDDRLINFLENDELRTIGNTKYFLFEISFKMRPHGLKQFIYDAQLKGYNPVLAHPERYKYLSEADLKDFAQRGVLFQLDLMALTGHYGKDERKKAEFLIDNDMYSFVGTDVHHYGHLEVIKKALHAKSCHKLIDSGTILNKKIALS